MYLKKLSLTNFRRFPEATVVFGDGILGIVGANGSGKSTLVEAVGYALYGSQPALTRTGKDDMKRSDAPDGEPWGVSLEFEYDGSLYVVSRKTRGVFDKYRYEVRITKDGVTVAKDDRPVRDYLLKMLGMEYRAFASSVFCRQSEVAMLSGMNPGDRKKLILKILRIIGMEDSIRALRKDMKDLKTRVKTIDETFGDASKEALIAKINDCEQEIRSLDGRLSALKRSKDDIEVRIRETNDERTTLLKNRSRLDGERKEMENIRYSTERARIIKKDMEDLENQISEQELLLADADESLMERLPELRQSNSDLTKRIDNKLTFLESVKTRISWLCSLTARCPTCEQVITSEYAKGLLDKQQRILAETEMELDRMKAERIGIEDEINDATAEYDKKTANDFINTRISDLRNSIAKKNAELPTDAAVSYDRSKHDEIESEINETDASIGKNDSDSKSLRDEYMRINDEIMETRASRDKAEADRKFRAERLKLHEENEKKISEYANRIEKYGVTEQVMTDFKMYLIGKVRPMLGMFTSQLVGRMTKGRYAKVVIDENYDIMMYDRGMPYPVQRFSGGEQALVNLALRLALSRMISIQKNTEGFGFIILDEVFGSADAEHRSAIMETLDSLKNIYSQIICITHIDSVVDMLPSTVRVRSDDSVSSII
jgi:exonuclease SbcC